MRVAVGLLVLATWASGGWARADQADVPAKRYGIAADLTYYPQDTPKNALDSVLKALERKRLDYLLAQLADPKFVDERVKNYGGNFDELVKETAKKLTDDPSTIKDLERFAKNGDWEAGENTATVTLKDVKDRRVFLRKVGTRWFLENRMKPDAEAK